MHITRPAIAVALALSVAACANGTGTTPAQVIADAQGAVTGLQTALHQVEVTNPTLIPAPLASRIDGDLTKAQAVASVLTTGLPAQAGAVSAQQIEGYINDVLDVLAGPPVNGLIPAPANQAVAAVAIVAPLIEAYVNQYLPQPAPKAAASLDRARLAALAPMSVAQARMVLGE